MTILTLTETSLWTYDLERGALTPLLREGEVAWPTWWPDGRRLAFSWLHDGRWSVAAQAADMTAPPEVLAILRHPVSSVSKDGRQIAAAFVQQGDDIMVVTPGQGKTVVEPWLRTPDVEMWPVFSPDGQWLAYGSNASGRFEVYVRPYPGPGQATQVSVDGGGSPAWRSDARELYFVSEAEAPGTLKMMAAGFTPQRLPRAGRPQALFAFDSRRLSFDCRPVRCYDVAPDGQRFYVQRSEPVPPPPVVSQITLVQNWFEELKAKVPAGR